MINKYCILILSSATYPYVKAAVLSTIYDEPCGCKVSKHSHLLSTNHLMIIQFDSLKVNHFYQNLK